VETITYYHVAGDGWNPGEALYCFDALERMGHAVAWKWEPEPIDTEVVCLFESRAEAEDMQAEYGGTVVTVQVPSDAGLIRVAEGYPARYECIPAEWISHPRGSGPCCGGRQ
jgi:hypothetical protein